VVTATFQRLYVVLPDVGTRLIVQWNLTDHRSVDAEVL
jgi:hypothetical protein